MRIIIGINFEGMDKFTFAEVADIKERVKKSRLTLKEVRLIVKEVEKKYGVNDKIAWGVTQYCIINRNQ